MICFLLNPVYETEVDKELFYIQIIMVKFKLIHPSALHTEIRVTTLAFFQTFLLVILLGSFFFLAM